MRFLDRNSLFVVLCTIIAILPVASCVCYSADLVLENDSVRVNISPENGAILSILDKPSGIEIRPDHAPAEIFRLVLAKPDKTTATIIGKDQNLSGSSAEPGALFLTWNGPLKDTNGVEHAVRVRMEIRANDRELIFTLTLNNDTSHQVQEVWYPLIGGVQKIGADACAWLPTSTPWQKPLRSTDQTPFGEHVFGYPGHMNMSFLCIQSASAKKSIYFSSHDTIARHKGYRLMGVSGSEGEDVFVCIQHLPFTKPGKSFDGSPIVLRIVEGDWKSAGMVYRRFFEENFGLADPETDWIRKQSFFLMTMFMLPEGTINYTFKDIPRWAKAAKKYGVNAVQISGWQMGGHDNGYPYYVPDPRLGTWKELEDGIRYCHKLGLKVFFFVNFQPMMLESDWYKNELHKYREWNHDGGLTWNAGWGMGTLWARMGHPKMMTWADLGFPEFRKIIVDQFEQLAKIGADGVHVDKMYPWGISHNPNSPMSPDTSTWEGAILLCKEVMAACRKHNPNWSMSFECNWDRMLQFGGCTWWVGNQLVTRSIFPENAETLAICMAYDYLGVNNAVRNGHHVMLAPMNFSRGMDWKPFEGLSRYIREVKKIQDSLQETVFLGEVMGREGVKLRGTPARGIDYNVFRNRRTGLLGCILTNAGLESQQQVIEALGKSAFARVHAPGQQSYNVKWPATIEIPGERIVFLEELAVKPKVFRSSKTLASTKLPNKGSTSVANGDFEAGEFEGWTADSNWVIANDSRGYYAGWQGKYWAWSGGTGEAAVGKLTSKPFRLDKSGVRLLISGWDSIQGSGKPRRWNYVTLNLADGTEIDRVYAPNTTNFVPVFLDGSKHQGKMVYIEAVDDADHPSYSMLCIDEVHTADLPADYTRPAPPIPKFDPQKSIRLEDENVLIEVSRSNGSVTRIHDKKTKLDLIVEPRLADNWKFALPLPGKEPWQTIEANWIVGRDQKLTSFEHLGNALVLRWDGPLTNYLGEKYDVSVETRIKLTQGGVLFDEAIIKNRTPYPVGETYYPILGGIQGLGRTRGELKRTQMFRPLASGDSAAVADIFHVFANMSAFGDQGPEQFYRHPEDGPPVIHFESSRLGRSVCLFSPDPSKRPLVTHLELVPSSSGTTREDGNWPRPEELNGMPAGVKFSFVDCAGSKTAKDYTAAPVFVKFHSDDWRTSRKLYEEWNPLTRD